MALTTLVWTYVAMLTGSAVVGAEADVACPAWPQCADGHILPLTGIEWVNFGHRLAVGLSDVLMLVLAVLLWQSRRHDKRLVRSAHILAALYVSQVLLGAFTIWLGAPEWLRGANATRKDYRKVQPGAIIGYAPTDSPPDPVSGRSQASGPSSKE